VPCCERLVLEMPKDRSGSLATVADRPKADMTWVLLNHLVCTQQQRLRDADAKHVGGLQIDYELEGGGLLDRKVGGLGALDDLIHVGCGAAQPHNVATASMA